MDMELENSKHNRNKYKIIITYFMMVQKMKDNINSSYLLIISVR